MMIYESGARCHQNQFNKEKSLSNAEYRTDNGFEELRRNYQDAVQCLMQCENIIQTLEEELKSKNERVETLEEKLVLMSLELASSKAFEDEHRSKRRETRPAASQVDERPRGRAASADVEESGAPIRSAGAALDKSNSSSRSLSNFGQLFRKHRVDRQGSDSSRDFSNDKGCLGQRGSALDESASSALSGFDFGHIFRKDKNRTSKVQADQEKKVDGKRDEEEEGDKRRLRRPNRRTEIQQSSRSFLGSAVLFPVSFEDCLEGCNDRSINKGLKNSFVKALENKY